jgi:hypothetical protein
VHINWNEHTRKLQEINAATFNFNSLVEFLLSAAFPESKYKDLNRILLKQALQNSGHRTVLMDGFDEISPTHADKAIAILSELLKTKARRVWVTSRPVQRERLEKKLSVAAFSMKKRSRHFQVNVLLEPCMLQNNPDISGLDMIRQREQDPDYVDPIIMQAANYGSLLRPGFLCSNGVNIHQASSRSFPSLLHAAIQREQLQFTRWLIQHGADCNFRYSDGKTPLFHAVTESSLDVVRVLVEEGGASVYVRDEEDRTVFDWMNDYASDPKNLDDIIWKGDVERLNEIVNYLQKRGVESSAVYG